MFIVVSEAMNILHFSYLCRNRDIPFDGWTLLLSIYIYIIKTIYPYFIKIDLFWTKLGGKWLIHGSRHRKDN